MLVLRAGYFILLQSLAGDFFIDVVLRLLGIKISSNKNIRLEEQTLYMVCKPSLKI